jgi:hypothetical protein
MLKVIYLGGKWIKVDLITEGFLLVMTITKQITEF